MLNRFSWIFSLVIVSLGALALLASSAIWLRFYTEAPVRDLAYILPLVQSGVTDGWQSISFGEWVSPFAHAHRIAITRLLMLMDYTFLGGKNYFLYLSLWISLLVVFLVYLKAARSLLDHQNSAQLFIAGVVLLFLCSPSQYMGLLDPQNASWYVAMAASAASFWLVLAQGAKVTTQRALLACLCASIAAFSNFSGVLTCLLLPLMTVFQRPGRWPLGLMIVYTTLFVALYLQGIGSDGSELAASPAFLEALKVAIANNPDVLTQTTSFTLYWNRLILIVSRTCLQLGATIGFQHPFVAPAAVLSSAVYIGYHWLKLGLCAYFKRELPSGAIQLFLAMATLCLAISCAIWFGRVAFIAPEANRYQTISMHYWLNVSCLLFFHLRQTYKRQHYIITMTLTASIPLILLWGSSDYTRKELNYFHTQSSFLQVVGELNPGLIQKSFSMILQKEWYGNVSDHRLFLEKYRFQRPYNERGSMANAEYQGSLCEGAQLSTKKSRWPGVQSVSIAFDSRVNPFLTKMYLQGADTNHARLYARVPPTLGLTSILQGEYQWNGFYKGDTRAATTLKLAFTSATGAIIQCELQ
jgi:hypothetical protein